jgi:hypothetical protein
MQPKAKKTQELESTFNVLATQWVKETGFYSNSASIIGHPAYKRIVELGESALPLVFRELEKGQMAVHWPHVLNAITGADPAPPPKKLPAPGWVALDIEAIHKAWLDWGREQGYQW